MNELPVVGCLASLDDLVRDAIFEKTISTGPIAQFTTGAVIHIDGIFKGKGYYGFFGIRWHTKERKGLFGKGIALYGRPFDLPVNLPQVK